MSWAPAEGCLFHLCPTSTPKTKGKPCFLHKMSLLLFQLSNKNNAPHLASHNTGNHWNFTTEFWTVPRVKNSSLKVEAGRLGEWWCQWQMQKPQSDSSCRNRKTCFFSVDSSGVHLSAPRRGILLMSESFQSQGTSTQMRTTLTRTSAPTLEDGIIKAANLVLLALASHWDGRNTPPLTPALTLKNFMFST